MPDVLEEMTGDAPVRAKVEARIDDWEHRIDELYKLVDHWLPEGWASSSNRHVMMFEEPMREVGLPPRQLPTLDLIKDGKPEATIEPRGLWIVGANGRLDLRYGSSHFFIIDKAENMTRPQWKLMAINDRVHQEPLDHKTLGAILDNRP